MKGYAMFIPNGRLSAVTLDGEKVQIQTEFAVNPRPRVTTTVVFSGRVVHKEERPWDTETDSAEGQKQLEAFLQRQHFEIHTRVEKEEISLAIKAPQAADPKVAMPETHRPPSEPARHPAGRTPGVMRLFIVSKTGELLAADDSGVPGAGSAGLFLAAADFIDYWESRESERFTQMITRDRDGNYLLVRHFGKYWGAELAPGADPDGTLQQFLTALEH